MLARENCRRLCYSLDGFGNRSLFTFISCCRIFFNLGHDPLEGSRICRTVLTALLEEVGPEEEAVVITPFAKTPWLDMDDLAQIGKRVDDRHDHCS